MAKKNIPQKQGSNSDAVGYKKPPAKSRFEPGRSGNPGGRPRGQSITALIREMLVSEKVDGVKPDGKTIAQRIALKIVNSSIDGDYRFVKELLDRTEGAPSTGDPLDGLDFNLLSVDEAQTFRQLFAKLMGR